MIQERTFLDTNIVADRKLQKKDIVEIIESSIGQTFKYCSNFVVSEHKKTFLKTMQVLWTFFKEKKNNEEILSFIENRRWKSSQEKNRYTKVFNWVTDHRKISYFHALQRLETIMFTYDQFFFADIDILESEVNCPLAGIRIDSRMEITDVSFACPLKCSLSGFLRDQKGNLIELQKKIKGVKRLGLVVAILQQVINNPDRYDEDMCRTLADTIIVLEAPDDFLICSNNTKDFKPICSALGKRFLSVQYSHLP